jgi:hypothetical protein
MTRSELAARYENFGRNIIVISREEFYDIVNKLEHSISWRHFDASTEVCTISTDGVEYMCYGSTYAVQGGYDGDSFYFKIITMTQAEIEELRKVFA